MKDIIFLGFGGVNIENDKEEDSFDSFNTPVGIRF
jgi:hypothetical protein